MYEEFTKIYFEHGVLSPILVERLSLLITFLIAKGYATALISSYSSALGYVHKIRGLSDPSTAFIVRRLLRSVHKSDRKGDTRLPITEPILLELVKSLTSVTNSYNNQVMFRSMFLLAFYGVLRIGEITVNWINNKNNLQLSNIKLFRKRNVASRIEITMHYFKLFKSNKPVIISIAQNANESMLCPVPAIVSFCQLGETSLGLYFATHQTRQ